MNHLLQFNLAEAWKSYLLQLCNTLQQKLLQKIHSSNIHLPSALHLDLILRTISNTDPNSIKTACECKPQGLCEVFDDINVIIGEKIVVIRFCVHESTRYCNILIPYKEISISHPIDKVLYIETTFSSLVDDEIISLIVQSLLNDKKPNVPIKLKGYSSCT